MKFNSQTKEPSNINDIEDLSDVKSTNIFLIFPKIFTSKNLSWVSVKTNEAGKRTLFIRENVPPFLGGEFKFFLLKN